jgi:hypothetical protein
LSECETDLAALITEVQTALPVPIHGRPPLAAPGLKLHERLTLIAASLERVAQKGAPRQNWSVCSIW